MARIIVASYGMSDMAIPMVRHLAASSDHDLTLVLIYHQGFRREGVVDLGDGPLEEGFLPAERVAEVLDPRMLAYIGGAFTLQIFAYHNGRFQSWRNARLSLRLMGFLHRFDLIHINGIGGTILQLLPFLRFRKWLITVHDFRQHAGEQSRWGEKLIDTTLKLAPAVIVQNRQDHARIERDHPRLARKTRYIPFGYLENYRAFLDGAEPAEEESELLFFGRISKYKGLEHLLDALEILREQGLNPHLTLAGSGDYDFGLKQHQGLHRVRFHNRFIENEELARLIAATRIVVCPYIEATQSGVLMTAFAFGKPVVASAVGSFRDLIQDGINGLLVPPADPAALADALASLLGDPDRVEQMAKNIRENKGMEAAGWPGIAERLQETYHELA